MRIVHLSPGWPPNLMRNGIVSSLGVLAPALRAQGCEVCILAMAGSARADDDDVVYLDEAAPAPRGLAAALRTRFSPRWHVYDAPPQRILRALAQVSPPADLIYMEESFGWYADVANRSTRPVVVGLRGPWFMNGAALRAGPLTKGDAFRIAREGRGLTVAAGVTAPSQYVLDGVREHYGLALPDAVVIRNPVRPVSSERRWRAAAADIDEILFIGRFDRHKGADIVLDAFAKLAETRPSLKLTLAGPAERPIEIDGASYTPDAYLRAFMKPEAARNVTFLGHVPFDELSALRARAFVTVVPSRFENLPNALLEAMAHGSPVVAADAGGIPEVARHGETAMLAPPADAAGFARMIETLLDSPSLAARLGEAARLHVERDFAPDSVARTAIAFYSAVSALNRA